MWIARLTTGAEQQQRNIPERMSQFASGELRECPICGGKCETVWCWQGIEYVVLYIQPCNCRLGCWERPPQWAVDAGIVAYDSDDDDEIDFDDMTDEELEAAGIQLELTPEYYRMMNEYQEQHGQKRLPGLDTDTGAQEA